MKYGKWHEGTLIDIRVGSNKPEGFDELPQNFKGGIGVKREWFDDKLMPIPEDKLIASGIRKDNRGKVYNINDGSTRVIQRLDEDLRDDETKETPLENEPHQKFDKHKKKWVVDIEKKEQFEKEKVTTEKRQRLSVIESRLDTIDVRRLRPKEAIIEGTATDEDFSNLARLDDEKTALKIEYGIINEELKSA